MMSIRNRKFTQWLTRIHAGKPVGSAATTGEKLAEGSGGRPKKRYWIQAAAMGITMMHPKITHMYGLRTMTNLRSLG
jgi:hypothetical protein